MADGEGVIQSRSDFRDSNSYWQVEIGAALKEREEFLKDGEEAVRRFLDDRKNDSGPKRRLNLYHANVSTERALLYGKTPSVDVARRFSDSRDDVARVAAEAMERLLNTDIDQDDDGFTAALKYAVEDWTCPGLGQVWMRYDTGEEVEEPGQEAQTEPCPACAGAGQSAEGPCPACQGSGQHELAPAVPPTTKRPDEEAEVDFVYWKDFLWSPCRNWHEVRWVAKRVEVTRDEAKKRGWKDLSYKNMRPKGSDTPENINDAWSRAEVWEIWCKEDETVYWYNDGCSHIVDKKPDPLELDGFLPCPRPLFANVGTGRLMPRPGYAIARDHYLEVDRLTERIANLIECAKVRWAYDASVPELRRIFDELNEGQGVGVSNWQALVDKGGLKDVMQFTSLQETVAAIQELSARRAEEIQLIYQVTGMSDIMRGQAAQRATATEQSIKAQFASTRMQTAQDELARFASDAQSIRAEIIAKHFMPETIMERSNMLQATDPQKAQAAVELLKSNFWSIRIKVRPESIALPDMATQRQERTEAVQGLGGYFQSMMPLIQIAAGTPGAIGPTMEFVIETGQWMISGLRGAGEVEEAFDKFAEAVKAIASQPPAPPQPNPQVQANQARAQADIQKTQMDMQAAQVEHGMAMQKLQAEAQADTMKTRNKIAVAATTPIQPPGVPNA